MAAKPRLPRHGLFAQDCLVQVHGSALLARERQGDRRQIIDTFKRI